MLVAFLEGHIQPLFFEVPQAEGDPLFMGRDWLFENIEQALCKGTIGCNTIFGENFLD